MLRKYENKFDKCGKIKSLKSAHFPHKILHTIHLTYTESSK